MVGHRLLGNTLLVMGDATDARSSRPRFGTLRPGRASPAGNAIWPRCGNGYPGLSPIGSVVAWVSRDSLGGNRPCDQRCARDRPPPNTSYGAIRHFDHSYLLQDHVAATAHAEECFNLAQEKKVASMIGFAAAVRGCVLAQTGKAFDAIQTISAWITGMRAMGATVWGTSFLSHLALAYAELGQFDDAGRYIDDAISTIETTKERWFEAETNRIAGEIALKSDAMKAEAYFERALAVARQQQAKSWELRAAMSMARLWRDQGNPQQARELLAPVYSWFTEGFDTLDLKEAKALFDELHV